MSQILGTALKSCQVKILCGNSRRAQYILATWQKFNAVLFRGSGMPEGTFSENLTSLFFVSEILCFSSNDRTI